MVEKRLGELLREERKRRGLTQGSLEDFLKITTAYISKIEKLEGEPSALVREKIVEFLNGAGPCGPVSAESQQDYLTKEKSPYIEKVAALMAEMDVDTQKDICLSVEKEKLLRDLLRQKDIDKKAG